MARISGSYLLQCPGMLPQPEPETLLKTLRFDICLCNQKFFMLKVYDDIKQCAMFLKLNDDV